MNEPAMTLQELQAKIAKHAWEDPAFEAEFMANPKATFEKYGGQQLPDSVKIHAHYNTPTELHFVIPRKPSSASDELSDADLERVAGGEIAMTTLMVTVSVLTSVAISAKVTVAEGEW